MFLAIYIWWQSVRRRKVLFSLPALIAGMGIHNPVELGLLQSYRTSTSKLVTATKGKDQFSLADHVKEIASSRTCCNNNLLSHYESTLESHYSIC